MSKFLGKQISTQFKSNSLSSSASSVSSLNNSPSSPHPVRETSVMVKSVDPSSGAKMVNKYLIIRELGRGVHGKVKLCQGISTISVYYDQGTTYWRFAHKRLFCTQNHTQDKTPKIKREIAIMKKCFHPNIVQLFEVIDDPNEEKIYLVLEYVEGGELQWKNENDEPVIPLLTVKSFLLQLVVGLEYLHYQGIIHRDIKPQNILINDVEKTVKIADFGVSFFSEQLQTLNVVDDVELAKTVGSPAFFAPELCTDGSSNSSSLSNVNKVELKAIVEIDELLQLPPSSVPASPSSSPHQKSSKFSIGMDSKNSALFQDTTGSNTHDLGDTVQPSRMPVGKAIDVWALGVTFYCMIFGRLPFVAQTEYELFSMIPRNPIDYPKDTLRGDLASNDPLAIDLLKMFLEKDPNLRISLPTAKHHPWLFDAVPGESENEKRTWLENSDPKIFGLQQMERDPIGAAARYDNSGRITVTETEVKDAVTVGVVFKKMYEAIKRRFSKGVSWMSPISPAAPSDSRWNWRRRSSALFHSTSNQSLGRRSDNSDDSSIPTSPVLEPSSASIPEKAPTMQRKTPRKESIGEGIHRRSSSVPLDLHENFPIVAEDGPSVSSLQSHTHGERGDALDLRKQVAQVAISKTRDFRKP